MSEATCHICGKRKRKYSTGAASLVKFVNTEVVPKGIHAPGENVTRRIYQVRARRKEIICNRCAFLYREGAWFFICLRIVWFAFLGMIIVGYVPLVGLFFLVFPGAFFVGMSLLGQESYDSTLARHLNKNDIGEVSEGWSWRGDKAWDETRGLH